ncbi:MAG: hypothetical protein ACRC37_08120, partial [Lentisphaeria bacterium]
MNDNEQNQENEEINAKNEVIAKLKNHLQRLDENPDLKNPTGPSVKEPKVEDDNSFVADNESSGELTKVISFWNWVVIVGLVMIPCVGFIAAIVWALDNGGNIERRNFARGVLISTSIFFALVALF